MTKANARPLTPGEIDLARSIFGDGIDYAPVRIVLGKWAFFQPKNVVMSPRGRIHFHPHGTAYRDDFSHADLGTQGLFIHEMTHVYQTQKGIFLPLKRHPFCRYDYAIKPGQQFERYGIEQQAMLVQHAFLIGRGQPVAGAPPLEQYAGILPFRASR